MAAGEKSAGSAKANYPLKVVYDAKAFTDADRGGGKGKYLLGLLHDHVEEFTGALRDTNIDCVYPIISRGNAPYLAWQQTSLPRILFKTKPDVFLAPYNTAPFFIPSKTKLVSIIHDLILLEPPKHPKLLSRTKERYRGFLQLSTMKRSDVIVTVSNFTGDAIRRLCPEARIYVIPNTISLSWFDLPKDEPKGQPPFILMVTSNVPHKNLTRGLEAFARYKQMSPSQTIFKLVGVSSSRESLLHQATSLGIAGAVQIEGFLTDTELQCLYRQATCVLLPSLMEGFGIPVLEAMASGTPLISSNTWALPEVGGDAPLYVDPTNVDEMARALHRVCSDAALQDYLKVKGLARAAAYHPEKVTGQAKQFWDELPTLLA
jgi:glycosyltransferase involved in cell wall biosynthesis